MIRQSGCGCPAYLAARQCLFRHTISLVAGRRDGAEPDCQCGLDAAPFPGAAACGTRPFVVRMTRPCVLPGLATGEAWLVTGVSLPKMAPRAVNSGAAAAICGSRSASSGATSGCGSLDCAWATMARSHRIYPASSARVAAERSTTDMPRCLGRSSRHWTTASSYSAARQEYAWAAGMFPSRRQRMAWSAPAMASW